MQLFYDPDFHLNNFTLNAVESKHCIKVLRHSKGDKISVLNGNGSIYSAEITDANPKACKLAIIKEIKEERRNYSLHIAVAPTKNIDRFEWFLEKSTEIGIEQITPIICEHSERKVIKPERLEKIITAATKQSLKAYRPILNPVICYSDFIEKEFTDDNKYIAHCSDSPKELLNICYQPNTNALILIGPEGDFSLSEIEKALKKDYVAISLGKARLRTETAAIMGCATFNIMNQII